MEKSIEELLAFFQRYGGIADFTGIDDDIRLFWQLPIRYLSDALEPARVSAEEPDRILTSYVALVLNGGFNAVVRHEPDAAIAGIFIGVPLIAFKACRLLALRLDLASGLPTRDESERLVVYPEKLTLPTSWQLGPDPCRQALDDITAFEEATPLDNNELATFMFDIMMRYVAMHECMHFVLGHARFCQIELGMNAFEDGNERRRELGGHTSQTMEFISDRHVIAGLSHDLQRGRLYHEWSRQPPEAIGVEPERWYRRILFVTLGLISRLWVLHDAAYREAKRASFSQSIARLHQMSSLAASTLGKVMVDASTPPATRVRAADSILNHTAKAIELEDLEARVKELEKSVEAALSTKKK